MSKGKEVSWRERKLPSGDKVDVGRYDGRGFVACAGLLHLFPFVGHLDARELGGRWCYPVGLVQQTVEGMVKTEYAGAGGDRTKALKTATADVAKLVELTSPKAPPKKAPPKKAPPSGLLFELPAQDPFAVARKDAKKDEARRVRQKASDERKAEADAKKIVEGLKKGRRK